MNYPVMFARLGSLCLAADGSAELQAFVDQLAHAPIWNDEDALTLLADWTERLDAVCDYMDGLCADENARVAEMQAQALAQLRGERWNGE